MLHVNSHRHQPLANVHRCQKTVFPSESLISDAAFHSIPQQIPPGTLWGSAVCPVFGRVVSSPFQHFHLAVITLVVIIFITAGAEGLLRIICYEWGQENRRCRCTTTAPGTRQALHLMVLAAFLRDPQQGGTRSSSWSPHVCSTWSQASRSGLQHMQSEITRHSINHTALQACTRHGLGHPGIHSLVVESVLGS